MPQLFGICWWTPDSPNPRSKCLFRFSEWYSFAGESWVMRGLVRVLDRPTELVGFLRKYL